MLNQAIGYAGPVLLLIKTAAVGSAAPSHAVLGAYMSAGIKMQVIFLAQACVDRALNFAMLHTRYCRSNRYLGFHTWFLFGFACVGALMLGSCFV